MLNFFREGLHYIYMTFFQTLTLKEETANLSKKEATILFLRTYVVACILAIGALAMGGGISEAVGCSFDWYLASQKLFSGLILGLTLGLALLLVLGLIERLVLGLIERPVLGLIERPVLGLVFGSLVGGLVLGFVFGLVGGLVEGLVYGLVERPVERLFEGLFEELVVFGLIHGLVLGLAFGLFGGLIFGLFGGLFGGLIFGLVLGLILGLPRGLGEGLTNAIYYLLAFTPIYFVVYFRSFYVLPHLLQYWHSGRTRNPFSLFQHSPVYWDQMIYMPLPFLQDWLVNLIKCDRNQGLEEIFFVARERPFQRKAAFNALVTVAGMDLQHTQSVNNLKTAADTLIGFPSDDEKLPKGLQDARRYINTISELAQDYQNRQTHVGQLNVLAELHTKTTAFHSAMKLTAAPVGTTFEPLAAKWLKMIENEQEKLHQQSTHNELPNPYIAGNPLEVRDQQLFVGRSDILLAIEQFILNADQRPSLLLYGRRRTGKSSTLLNLPRSRFEPVYIDCQDAKWHESDQAFCYNLAHDLFNVLYQSDSVRGLRQPQIEQFDKNAFTQLDQFLTQAQKIADQRGKRILLAFDEYEELENSIINGDISEKVLGKLRNLIQHSKSIVVLVSGSHRFEELTRLNWANYLINTRTLELSYLDAESARELLTKPVPELHYEAGVVDDIIRITHCQPYLLQAVASELVNYLNSKQQTTATPDDLNTALEKTLVSASAYFSDTWRKDNSEAEQQVMRALATGKTESVLTDAAFQPAIQSLIRKEIVEGTEGSYRLAVELFARWIVKNQV